MPRCSVTRRVHFNAAHRLHNPDALRRSGTRRPSGCATTRTTTGTTTSWTSPSRARSIPNRLRDGPEPPEGDRRGAAAAAPGPQEPEPGRAWFRDLIPTSENIAVVCWRELGPALPADLTLRLRLWETPRNYVDYRRRRDGTARSARRTWPRPERPTSSRSPTRSASILRALGEDPGREGWSRRRSGSRRSLRFSPRATGSGRRRRGDAVFEENHQSMIMVRDIELYSLCEHHMLPFFGRAHVAYIPNGKIVGLSKLPRIVDVFARRLQVQERLTDQIADAIMEVLAARGRRRGHRGGPLLHDDARRGEAELPDGHERASRHLPRRLEDPGRVPPAGARGHAGRVSAARRPRRAGDRRIPRHRRGHRRRPSGTPARGWCGWRGRWRRHEAYIDLPADLADAGTAWRAGRAPQRAAGVPDVLVSNAGGFLLRPLERPPSSRVRRAPRHEPARGLHARAAILPLQRTPDAGPSSASAAWRTTSGFRRMPPTRRASSPSADCTSAPPPSIAAAACGCTLVSPGPTDTDALGAIRPRPPRGVSEPGSAMLGPAMSPMPCCSLPPARRTC